MKTERTQELYNRVFRLNRLVFHKMEQMTESTHGEIKMLGVIKHEIKRLKEEGSMAPGVTASKISSCLMHSKPATSKMLNSLEEKGYIERITTKEDRRAVYIVLTETGQKVIDAHHEQMDIFVNEFLEKLGEQDTGELFRILDRIYELLNNEAEK